MCTDLFQFPSSVKYLPLIIEIADEERTYEICSKLWYNLKKAKSYTFSIRDAEKWDCVHRCTNWGLPFSSGRAYNETRCYSLTAGRRDAVPWTSDGVWFRRVLLWDWDVESGVEGESTLRLSRGNDCWNFRRCFLHNGPPRFTSSSIMVTVDVTYCAEHRSMVLHSYLWQNIFLIWFVLTQTSMEPLVKHPWGLSNTTEITSSFTRILILNT
jgi:hypothetical protein